jgi:hypothetical protein
MHLSEITPETAILLLNLSLQVEADRDTCIPERYRSFFITTERGWQLSDAAFDAIMQVEGIHLSSR